MSRAKADATAIDRAAIAGISGGAEAQRRLMEVFAEAQQADALTIAGAIRDRDAASLARAAHRMLGASRIIGATGLERVSHKLLLAATAGDWETIASDSCEFNRELLRVKDDVAVFLGTPANGSGRA